MFYSSQSYTILKGGTQQSLKWIEPCGSWTDLMYWPGLLLKSKLKVHWYTCWTLYYLSCPLILLDLTLMSPVYSVDFPVQHTAAVCLDPAGCSHSGPARWGGQSQCWELSQWDCSISVWGHTSWAWQMDEHFKWRYSTLHVTWWW